MRVSLLPKEKNHADSSHEIPNAEFTRAKVYQSAHQNTRIFYISLNSEQFIRSSKLVIHARKREKCAEKVNRLNDDLTESEFKSKEATRKVN